MRRLSLVTFAIVFLSVTVGVASAATDVSQLLRTADDAIVTRGDFLRAAVESLALPHDDETPLAGRVPRRLLGYVHAADARGALAAFGSAEDLRLATGITRGEALVLLGHLQRLSSERVVEYRDARSALLREAVGIALDQGWMEPDEDRSFGVARGLSGHEARLLLRKVRGEGGMELDVPGELTIIPVTRQPRRDVSLPEQAMLETVWQLLIDHYVETEKLDPQEAAYRAAEALVGSVEDPYTTFMRPVEAADYEQQLGGEVSGIGAQVEQRDGQLIIITPLEGSPAETAGLQPEDVILKVDGESIEGLSLLEAVSKVRGPKGTSVTLTIDRGGVQIDVTIVRANVSVPEIRTSWQGTVAVVRLTQFGEITQRDFRRVAGDLLVQQPTGLVLDLRNNPGGYVDAAEAVLSAFLPRDTVVLRIERRTGKEEVRTTAEPIVPTTLPLVVLINKGSASASEVVTGALQDEGRARVVGETSFGKGTMQSLIPLNDGSTLKLTIAHWHTPKDRAIDGDGITPDEVVVEGARDEQMLRALELLR
jgi:carboxyl-terminal processing protease